MPAPKKPVITVVFGILHLVFGVLGLICSVCGASSIFIAKGVLKVAFGEMAKTAPAQAKQDLDEISRALDTYFADVQIYALVDGVISAMLAVVLIVAGVGLLKVASWGRWLSVGWATLRILHLIAGVALAFFVLYPREDQFNREMKDLTDRIERQRAPGQKTGQSPQFGGGGNPWIGRAFGLVMMALMMLYAAIVFIAMLLPNTGRAFAAYQSGESFGTGPAPPGDYYDEEYERRRREADRGGGGEPTDERFREPPR